jgi:hypothetical protein
MPKTPKTTKTTQKEKRPTAKKKLPASEVRALPYAPKLSEAEKADSGLHSAARKPVTTKLPSGFNLTKQAFRIIAVNWKLLLGYALIYLLMNLLLVQGLSSIAGLTTFKHKV